MVETAVRVEEEEGEGEGSTRLTNEASLLVQQISANIVDYCRVTMTMGGEIDVSS